MHAADIAGEVADKALAQLLDLLVKGGRIILAVGHGQGGIARHVGAERVALHHVEQFEADVLPVFHRIDWRGRRYHAQVGDLREF